jgi:hypothetical protein
LAARLAAKKTSAYMLKRTLSLDLGERIRSVGGGKRLSTTYRILQKLVGDQQPVAVLHPDVLDQLQNSAKGDGMLDQETYRVEKSAYIMSWKVYTEAARRLRRKLIPLYDKYDVLPIMRRDIHGGGTEERRIMWYCKSHFFTFILLRSLGVVPAKLPLYLVAPRRCRRGLTNDELFAGSSPKNPLFVHFLDAIYKGGEASNLFELQNVLGPLHMILATPVCMKKPEHYNPNLIHYNSDELMKALDAIMDVSRGSEGSKPLKGDVLVLGGLQRIRPMILPFKVPDAFSMSDTPAEELADALNEDFVPKYRRMFDCVNGVDAEGMDRTPSEEFERTGELPEDWRVLGARGIPGSLEWSQGESPSSASSNSVSRSSTQLVPAIAIRGERTDIWKPIGSSCGKLSGRGYDADMHDLLAYAAADLNPTARPPESAIDGVWGPVARALKDVASRMKVHRRTIIGLLYQKSAGLRTALDTPDALVRVFSFALYATVPKGWASEITEQSTRLVKFAVIDWQEEPAASPTECAHMRVRRSLPMELEEDLGRVRGHERYGGEGLMSTAYRKLELLIDPEKPVSVLKPDILNELERSMLIDEFFSEDSFDASNLNEGEYISWSEYKMGVRALADALRPLYDEYRVVHVIRMDADGGGFWERGKWYCKSHMFTFLLFRKLGVVPRDKGLFLTRVNSTVLSGMPDSRLGYLSDSEFIYNKRVVFLHFLDAVYSGNEASQMMRVQGALPRRLVLATPFSMWPLRDYPDHFVRGSVSDLIDSMSMKRSMQKGKGAPTNVPMLVAKQRADPFLIPFKISEASAVKHLRERVPNWDKFVPPYRRTPGCSALYEGRRTSQSEEREMTGGLCPAFKRHRISAALGD